MPKEKILVIGSSGQIGTELVEELRKKYGTDSVVASDLKAPAQNTGPFEELDVMDAKKLSEIIRRHGIGQVYLLAAMLSATAEKNPAFAWKLNMESLFHVLELAKEGLVSKIFWPSSIAVFGPNSPRKMTPQYCVMEPGTVYGISKQAGERWCEYYFKKYKADVRSLRYPGLIGYKSPPGGGTTDYAVHIFHQALKTGQFECFLSENTRLPMMYMPDAIRATISIMEAPAEKIKIRSGYNIAGMSFSPDEISMEIKRHIHSFTITYKQDYRQQIADGWPESIDDSPANEDWGWKPAYSLPSMVEDMLKNLANI